MQSLQRIWLGIGISATLLSACVAQPDEAQRAATVEVSDAQCDAPAVGALGSDIDGALTDLDASFACDAVEPPGPPIGTSDLRDASHHAQTAPDAPAPTFTCAVLLEPSALDQQLSAAEAEVALRTQQLAAAQQLTAPEIAEAKLRLAKAQYVLTKLQARKAMQNAANAANPARARADAAVMSAEADLALGQATLAAAQARVAALNQLVNFAACQADLIAAQLAASNAANAVATATAKLVAAKLAQQAITP